MKCFGQSSVLPGQNAGRVGKQSKRSRFLQIFARLIGKLGEFEIDERHRRHAGHQPVITCLAAKKGA